MKVGRKSRRESSDLVLNANSIDSSRSNSDIPVKVNGGPYLSQSESQSPSSAGSHHPSSMRNFVDQYQPQGGNSYQPPMLSGYNNNPQYGSYIPQVPSHGPHHAPMFDTRPSTGIDGIVDMDSASNSTHRMTNSRLKTLIHSRQNQREQLMPISNPEPGFNSSLPVSPVAQQSPYPPQYLPPNHDGMHNSMQFPSSSNSSSFVHMQQLSPRSSEGPRALSVTPQPASWPESSPSNVPGKSLESSPSISQKSPLKPSAQNGHIEPHSKEASSPIETKAVNGTLEQPNESSSNNRALDSSATSERVETPKRSSKSELESSGDKGVSESRVQEPCDNNQVMMPPQTPPPRYATPNPGFMTPPHAYRHLPPHHSMNSAMPPNCMPPPSSLPSPMMMPHPSTNGIGHHHPTHMPNETNCDEPNQSSPFLLNTTTSMNTYINITSTYNSKLSFSNATCLPTYAYTSMTDSSPVYTSSYSYCPSNQPLHANSAYMLPKGGGTAMSCIDSGRIQDSFQRLDVPPDYGQHQGLPLQPLTPPVHHPQHPSFHPSPHLHPYHHNSFPMMVVNQKSQELDGMERIEKLRSNTKIDPPQCDCLKNREILPSEKLPYYTHLGSGSSVSAIRELMEFRSGEKGNAIRIEKLLYSSKEGKTSQGCPLAKWIIRRSGPEEKFLTVIRHRPGHTCRSAYIIIALVAWEGVSQSAADILYQTVVYKTVNFGIPTQRKCGTNEMRTCACQGLDPDICGASFSFGCSWSMYYNGCKFARSKNARKFKLTEKDEEKELEDKLQNLATDVSELYKRMAPDSFQNQTEFEMQASDCRLGLKKGRPFSGVTACLDYCAHSHKDLQNMNNGCTVVVTLTKNRGWEKPEDEQLHVLPLYLIDSTDEYGSKEGQDKKISSGALEVLSKYPIDFRVRTTPLKPCKTRGRKPKDGFSPRKLAVQNAFKQLIASGKLHRIEPPLKNNFLNNNLKLSHYHHEHILPDSRTEYQKSICEPPKYDNSNWCESNICVKNEKAGASYAGKHILSQPENPNSFQQVKHSPPSDFNPNSSVPNSIYSQQHNSSAQLDNASNYNDAIFTSASNGVTHSVYSSSNSYPSSLKSEVMSTSYTNQASKSHMPVYNLHDNNNNIPYSSQGVPQGQHQSFPYCSDQNPNIMPHANNSYYTSYPHYQNPGLTNAYTSNYNSFQHSYFHQYPNIPLKIPGNYAAANTYSVRFPHSNSMQQHMSGDLPYSGFGSHYSGFTNIAYSTPSYNKHGSIPEPNNNYTSNQYPSYQSSCTSSSISSLENYANTALSDKDNKYSRESSSEKAPDPKDVKKEEMFMSGNSTPKQPCSDDSYSKNIIDNHAKNYNYHLQQTVLNPDLEHSSNLTSEFPSSRQQQYYSQFKEGYEATCHPPNSYKEGSNQENFKSQNFYSDSEKASDQSQANMLGQKYSNDSMAIMGENYIDSTTEMLNGDEIYEGHSDNESSFQDQEVGGVAIALTHGSVLFECAKHELHATTALKKPNRTNPTRISLVFYQHKHLNFENHGEAEWDQKMKEKRIGGKNLDMCFDVSPNKKQCVDDDMVKDTSPLRLPGTTPTTSWVTVFSLAPLAVGAPYMH